MNTEPTTDVLDDLRRNVDTEIDRQVLDDDQAGDETGDGEETVPTIDLVVDGRTLDDAEVEALLQKPLEELSDAEREGLQPLFDAARAQQPQGVDVLTIAGDVLQDAIASLMSKPPAGRRLEHKIALGHALAALVQAHAARQQSLLTQQQLQIVVQAQQAQVAKAAGPAGILVPNVRLHG